MCFHECDETSYSLHQFHWALVCIFKDYLCLRLVFVMLIFVWSSPVIKPVSIQIIVIPVLERIPQVRPVVLLVPSVSIVVSVEILSALAAFIIQVSAIASEIWSRIVRVV